MQFLKMSIFFTDIYFVNRFISKVYARFYILSIYFCVFCKLFAIFW